MSVLKKLKAQADKIFSLYIRRKDAVNGIARCVTCGKMDNWENMQAGHYIPRNWLKLRYDERNVHVQCVGCNCFKKGAMDEYARFLVKKYGVRILARLAKDKVPHQMKSRDYQEIIDRYAAYNAVITMTEDV